jgi:hypothetical protein
MDLMNRLLCGSVAITGARLTHCAGPWSFGHSNYGTPDNDPPGILAWIEGNHDQTFTVFFNQTNAGSRAADVGRDGRANFFRSIAFYNFVAHSLGEKDDLTPTVAGVQPRSTAISN